MSCNISVNGLSIESARSFSNFVRDYLYEIFRTVMKVSLVSDDTDTYFHLEIVNGKLPISCEYLKPWLELEFSNLFLLDTRFYIGKGPLVEFICTELGRETFFFNDYIFADSELDVSSLVKEYKNKNYYGIKFGERIFDFLNDKNVEIKAQLRTGIVFMITNYIPVNWDDEFQTWCRKSI